MTACANALRSTLLRLSSTALKRKKLDSAAIKQSSRTVPLTIPWICPPAIGVQLFVAQQNCLDVGIDDVQGLAQLMGDRIMEFDQLPTGGLLSGRQRRLVAGFTANYLHPS